MWDNLTLLSQYIFGWMSDTVIIIFSNGIISIFFAIFIVKQVSKLLQKIR